MIRLDDVWKSHDGRPVLRGVTLHVDQGDAVLITGASGSGKTTLLRLLYMADRADSGRITIASRDVSRLRPSSVPYVRRNLGVVLQDLRLMDERSVCDNVAVAAQVLGLSRVEVHARVRHAIEAVGLTHEADRKVGTLSCGVKQRVAVARALCADPEILLLDEPTDKLDPMRARDLLDLLEGQRARGKTLMAATHDGTVVAFGAAHGWRRAVLLEGRIVSGGLPSHEMLARDEDAGRRVEVGPARGALASAGWMLSGNAPLESRV